MVYDSFHFETAPWLFGLALIPAVCLLYSLFHNKHADTKRLDGFIDAHLIQHLLLNRSARSRSVWKSVLLWSLLWSLLMVAMAGPRWDFREIEVYQPDQNLVILLDLSQSMNAEDVKPSRIVRAKQEIEDILRLAQGVKIALIAFAADPHMINPLTDDMGTIRHLLPSLDTDLIHTQGSRLSLAFDLAVSVLTSNPGGNNSMLVVSDGGFEDSGAIATASRIADKGIVIHTMGIGSTEGAPVKNAQGGFIKVNGNMVISRLEAEKLKEISRVGGGEYLQSHYSDTDGLAVLNQLALSAKTAQVKQQKTRHWEERFYLLILPVMAILLFGFRKGFVFLVFLLVFSLPVEQVNAVEIGNYFKNDQQLGKQALENEDYETAAEKFKDPYRQGVAQYRAGNFVEAERLFKQASRPEIAEDALYNLGNALARQHKYDDAIETYESLLDQNPTHEKAKHNLDLIKKLRSQQQADQDSPQKDDNKNKNSDDNQAQHDGETADEKDKQSSKSETSSQDKEQRGDAATQGDEEDQKNDQQSSQSEADIQDKEQRGDTAAQGDEEDQKMTEGVMQDEEGEEQSARSLEDLDADQWLNRLTNDPRAFLKNQFYLESQRRKTEEGSQPW